MILEQSAAYGSRPPILGGLVVHVVDDDPDALGSLVGLLESLGQTVKPHASAEAFLAAYDPDTASCLVLDLSLPGMSGFDLLGKLASEGISLPTLILSGSGDVQHVVASMRRGANGYLQKPPAPERLLDQVTELLELARDSQRERSSHLRIQRRYATLTPREREVLVLLLQGSTVKQIACALEMKIRTAHIHRANILRKFVVETTVQLVQMRESLYPLMGRQN